MTLSKLILRSLRYYWRSNLAVVFGAAVAVAALVGSLAVGDSVKGSLRDLALERLGRTRWTITTPFYFRQKLADGYPAEDAAPALLLDATAKRADGGAPLPRVNVVGVDGQFMKLFATTASPEPLGVAGRRVAVNGVLARDLGVAKGDALLVTFGRRGTAPVHSLFGRRDAEHTVNSFRAVVDRIVPASGMGRFSLRHDEPQPRNLYVDLAWLQQRLDREGQINTILLDGTPYPAASGKSGPLVTDIRLEDVGLRAADDPRRGIVSIQSRRLVLPGFLVKRLKRLHPSGNTSVYLANTVAVVRDGKVAQSLPYAVVAGLDPTAPPPVGPLPMVGGAEPPALGDGDILLNAWGAGDLGARVGDTIELAYYEADDQGKLATARRRFTLRGVVAMDGLALDPALVPQFEGITDAESMGDWDPPFPIERQRIRPKDEDYWDKHRAAPKAFVARAVLADMWLPHAATRNDPDEGWVTSVRIPRSAIPEAGSPGAIDRYVLVGLLPEMPLEPLGIVLRPVREEALRAAEGSTDFGVLFVSMSFFLVAAAAGLVFLLLRLTAERRAGQLGILLATGFTTRQAARVLVGEGAVLAAIGSAAGAPLGMGYAAAIIQALRNWWSGAAGDFTFTLHVRVATLVIGAASGFAVALLALWWSARMLRRAQALELLAGWRAMAAEPTPRARRIAGVTRVVSFTLVTALLVLSVGFHVVSPTGAFFGIGTGGLVLLLALTCQWLQRRRAPLRGAYMRRAPTVFGLGVRETSRNWLRSVLTVGLVAAASFLIVTVSANRRDLTRIDTRQRGSGAGGFDLIARSDVAIHQDIGTPDGRDALGFSSAAMEAMAGCVVVPLRASAGDDASCLNMTRPTTPRVLGVPQALIDRGGFAFAKHRPLAEGEENPWRLLAQAIADDGPTPVVAAFADASSAQWILKIGLGDDVEIPDGRGGRVRLRLVGMLVNSIFQSELLVSEANFRRHFGTESGYRTFLIASPAGRGTHAVEEALRGGLGEWGLDVRRTADVLDAFGRVQNTYLSTFETLGGLGLLLGTFGVVAVLLRGVLEQRGELAMLLALGFRRRTIFAKIVIENTLLLLLGVAIGATAALVAVLPHLLSSVADVPWASLLGTLGACVVVGVASCTLATAAALRGNLLAALRSE